MGQILNKEETNISREEHYRILFGIKYDPGNKVFNSIKLVKFLNKGKLIKYFMKYLIECQEYIHLASF